MDRFNAHILKWREEWWCLYPTGVMIPCLSKQKAEQMAAIYNRILCRGISSGWLWWRGIGALLENLEERISGKKAA